MKKHNWTEVAKRAAADPKRPGAKCKPMSALGLLLAVRLFRASNKESPTQKELIDGHD